MCDVLDIAEQKGEERGIKLGEERGAKVLGDLIRRLLNGEDANEIHNSGVDEYFIKIALGVLEK